MTSIRITLCLFAAALMGASGCSPETTNEITKDFSKEASFSTKVIYGEDDRLDWFNVEDENLLKLADSTVALINNFDLEEKDDADSDTPVYTVDASSPRWCSDEPFVDQKTAAFCSGFLLAPDIIVTAGHCIRSQSSCESTSFVFGFARKTADFDYLTIPKSEVYNCKELISSDVVNTGADYAVIRIDRAVENHAPLSFRREGTPAVDDNLTVIGHPSGLPSKVAGGSTVRSIESGYFVANLDTYGGNSGSAVFNTDTGVVEGILVRGERDFVYENGCQRSNICENDGCRGEDVTLIAEVSEFIPELEPVPSEEEAEAVTCEGDHHVAL